MASRIRTIDFLPEIFRTETNDQFLRSTLDQLVQNPKLKPTQGYIGRKAGPGIDPNDNYVLEPNTERSNYQLEPGVVFLKENNNTVTDALTYPGLIDTLDLEGANIDRHDRLFASEHYSWDPFIDFDKFVNFGQYYWLPEGPDRVNVSATNVPLTDDFDVARTDSGYTISGQEGNLPTITLVRQGSYTFDVNQLGNSFWIQSTPGSSGVLPQASNQSSRDVLGVINNGDDVGTITFNVPNKNAQNFYFELDNAGSVSLVTDLKFDQINNIFLDQFVAEHGGIDGIKDLDGRTLIFTNRLNGEDSGWFATSQFDTNTSGYDTTVFDASVEIGLNTQRYSVWRITLVYDENGENPYISLSVDRSISNLSKLLVEYGTENSNVSYYKTAEGYFERVPLITANLDVLYYQDGNDDNRFGIIKLVDQVGDQTLDIDEIIGAVNYTSPNGVTFTNGLKVQFEGTTDPESYSGKEYYVEGVGSSIVLVPAEELVTPESYTRSSTEPYDSTPFDETAFDDTLNAPLDLDYLTINRASIDRNPWSRSNRWFHVDVINQTAAYNKVDPVIDNDYRAKRPILEFRANLRLFNFGTSAIRPIDIIDFGETDAFSNINGTIGYSVDGYNLISGSTIIFANDRDPAVRNKVYLVNFVQFDDSSDPVIDLQPADITSPGNDVDQVTVCISGITLQGKSFRFDGNNWIACQEKTGVNQAPLFDVYDTQGNSYGNSTVYPGSSFIGTKLFSYAVGSGVTDTIIGQPLKYLTINNVGDIVFQNNLYIDTFVYVDGTISTTKTIDDGTIRQYTSRTGYNGLLGWQTSFTQDVSRQNIQFVYEGRDLVLDVLADTNSDSVPVKVFVDGQFLLPSNYTYTTNQQNVTVVSFVNAPAIDSIIEVSVISKQTSRAGYYSIPDNLQDNAINVNQQELTLGTIRNHYETICQNKNDFAGSIHGSNNTRDIGNLIPYGEKILQQSSPLTIASVFLYNKDFDFCRANEFSANEYNKYKNLILDTVTKNDWGNKTAKQILDDCFNLINVGKNQMTPFYWTDMVPCGQTFDETVYTITPISGTTFDTLYTYDFTTANYQGILVYLNDEILLGDDHEYTVATDGPRITVLVPLTVGDKLTIREYQSTVASYVPATPTKLGLYPAYEPKKYLDNSYVTPTNVILGHDGSITVAFDDIRDDVLLEFEKRVYNNIKVANRYNPPIDRLDVIPGYSRETDYNLGTVTEILGESFLSWVGTNKLPYKTQTYDANNSFTWNYSASSNKFTGETLLGGWRAIYFDLYDTDTPHTTPWEMLGITEEPEWWQEVYGPAPYTSGNLVLWEDLAQGKLADPAGSSILSKFVRPQLTDMIPVDSEGNLLSPFDVIVGNYDQNSFRKSWTVGDMGAVETAWRRSSYYPFAVQRLLALTKPAEYFSLFVDNDRYVYNSTFKQYLYDNRFRIDPTEIEIYGDNTPKHSYINMIVDYNRVLGLNSTELLTTRLNNIDVRLCYRLASFSDKSYLKIFTEKSSPNSLNTSLLLPDESYQLLLYKNPAFSELTWSSVIVQSTSTGWTVFGYSTTNPYFEIVNSLVTGRSSNITVNGTTVRVAKEFGSNITRVPYGYEFTSITSVVDFLVSYGEYLTRQGMTFENVENNTVLNWNQMAQEFIYWTQQGWAEGSIINLNPAADKLTVQKDNAVAEPLNQSRFDVLLNQNRQPIKGRDFVVERLGNNLTLRALDNNTFNYLNARFTAYEHLIVFDNTSIFNDLIYEPSTGSRQGRLLLNGYTTFEWDGTLDAQGFILNQDNVEEWQPNTSYSKGQIVLYKDSYWSAAKLIPPSQTFDFNVWIKSDYEKITKGLLPNLSTKSSLMQNYYDINTANLESDADLLGFGLIGFRPRQYMQNLNLNDISQVNLYQQFLGTKGTTQAAEIFTKANLGKEVAEYEILENWAINRATYGANANRSYFELRLNEANLLGNPSTIAVIEPGDTSLANQTVLLQNLWKQSYKITNKNILPTLSTNVQDVALPSAGYVNFDDVDIKVFDFNDLSELINNIDEVEVGSTIWVAKSNSYDWNVYRTNLVLFNVTQVKDNLNGRCTVTFSGNHGLSTNDRIVIKNFDSDVDGAYQVLSTPGLKSITIALSLPGEQTTVTGNGVCFVLETVRVSQASDIANLSYSNNLLPGNQAWVDNDGTDHWAVYEKEDPFGTPTEIEPPTQILNNQFGISLTQGFTTNLGALVGATGYNSGVGAVYTYNKSDATNYVSTGVISLQAADVTGFGNALDSGNNEWGIAGASASESNRGYAVAINRNSLNGTYLASQLFNESTTSSGSQFGYSVTISRDERWMYIGAPGDDTVYAYNRIDVQSQQKDFVGDGSTRRFLVSDVIRVDDDSADGGIGSQQIGVLVNNVPKAANVDWDYNGESIIFATAPNTGDEIRVSRLQSKTFFPTSTTTVFNIEDLYTATDIYSFSVYVNDVLQRPIEDYTFNSGTKDVTLTAGVIGTVVFNSNTHWKLVDTFTISPGDSSNIDFGYSIATTTDGRQIIVGAPSSSGGDELDDAGKVYIFDRSVERFQISNPENRAITTLRTPAGQVVVKVNNTFLNPGPSTVNNNSEFSVSGSIVTIDDDVALAVGDIVEIETNTFKLMQTLESNTPQGAARFGEAVDQCSTNCSVYVGQPNDSIRSPESGSVERWQNQNRLYGTITGTVSNPTLTATDTIRINNYDVTLTGSTVASLVEDINDADIPNVLASSTDGKLSLSLVDASAADEFIKLLVLPGLGTAFSDLGLEPITYAQTIIPPIDVAYGHFGQTLQISDTATTLVVGAPDSTAAKPTTFDTQTTIFDSGATEYFDLLPQSGVVYTYDLLPAANATVNNSSKFVFGQQIFDASLTSLDKFGKSVNYTGGVLWIGAPQDDLGDSSGDFGRISQFTNVNRTPAWDIIYRQQDIVDASLINSVFTYDKVSSQITQYLDYIDPLQGKILGSAKANIDYILSTDPAKYNTGTVNNYGDKWDDSHIGEIWWNITNARFIDYHQDTVEYKAKRWGQLFPGSSIDVYQWTENDVPPAQYSGEGTVFSTTSYTVGSELDIDGTFNTKYYYWVKGITSVSTSKGKTLSASAVAQYIESPKSSGIPYLAAVSPNTLALYNCRNLIGAQDTILHVEFDRLANTDNVHVEYDLITDGKSDSFLSDGLYRKMLDSFCGTDSVGNLVPDATLSIADKYGVNFRPRQSFFVDRFLALENYLTRANAIFAQFPVSNSRRFDLLNSEEPEPTSVSGEWNMRVATYAELLYQDLLTVPAGYKYLVASDSENNGLWTIYTLQSDKSLLLTRVQNYDTKLFWEYIDWVQPGYNSSLKPDGDVDTFSDLLRLTDVAEGISYKVNTNSFGKYEVYQYTSGEWERVVLEDGTIRLKDTLWDYTAGRFGFDVEVFDAQRWDQNPAVETRQILKAINEELLVGDLAIYKNELLMLVFEYILTEQAAPEWLFKTSLVDVDHKIRDLEPFQVFRRDNQDFVLDYINEVKPYHVKIKEFNLRYEGQDNYLGTLTDFDLPAYFDEDFEKFISPILTSDASDTDPSAKLPTDPVWTSVPWNQWYNNYLLSLSEVDIVEGGSGYTVAPQVTVTGTAVRDAVLSARINSAGQVVEIEVVDPGEGYLVTPTITISGGNGSGAIAVAVMNNQMVRSFDTTMKFDRYEYTSSVQDWQPDTKYTEGSLVRYLDKVYSVNNVEDSSELLSGPTFDPENYTLVDADTLSGADRIIGLYDPDPSDPGRELALVLAGIDYPGVQVTGPDFNQNTGFDVGAFDVVPFDNIDFGPEGFPTYSEEILDTVYTSSFLDTYLGTRSTDVNVEGGGFVDTYSSHAPEELVPGAVFDTLSLKVYTHPGADWEGDGHGFDIKSVNIGYNSDNPTIDVSGKVPVLVNVIIVNRTLEIQLLPGVNFSVDWLNQTVTVLDGVNENDVLEIRLFSPGGGNQLFRNVYSGTVVNAASQSVTVPVNVDLINELLVLKNGSIVSSANYTYSEVVSLFTKIQFTGITFENTDAVTVVVLGTSIGLTEQRSWSFPITESFIYDGSTDTFTLTNSLDDSGNLKGTNEIDMFVVRDGKRLRPPETIQYTGDGSSAGPYYLPTRGEINQGLIAENDVKVYVDNQEKFLAVDWTLTPWDGSSDRYIEFATAPAANSTIKVAVTTEADYTVNGDQLTLRVGAVTDAIISVVTFNDTSEQQLLTQVFQGPTTGGIVVQEPYDSQGFDEATLPDTSGSFDYTIGVETVSNVLELGVEILDSERIIVHKNGLILTPNAEFTINGSTIEISGSILGPGDVVVVTTMTQYPLPDGLQFQIFQDMLGNQKLSRLRLRETPFLAQSLAKDDDVIYVTDASLLTEPDPTNNTFGVVSIEGERITYRTRNTVNNTLSGLRRGVAGTGVADHNLPLPSGLQPFVRDESIVNQLPAQYQKTVYQDIFSGDGSTRTYVATNVVAYTSTDSTELDRAIRVKVGGTELVDSEYTVDQIDPVQVTLVDTPANGVEVVIYTIQASVMYAQGVSTASNGLPLQEQTTTALKFLRGDI